MFQKFQKVLEEKEKDKKGQAIIELAFGTMMVGTLLMAIFDFALIVQTKTETMMMARNGVRYMIMQGVSPTSSAKNQEISQKTEGAIKGIYIMNHNTAESKRLVRLGDVKVENTKHPVPIKNSATGQNPVFVEVCEVVSPIGSTFTGPVKICSAYGGFHSSQTK